MRAPAGIRVGLAGGGTGGHLFPGLAVARSLLPPGSRPHLFGSGQAAERDWIGDQADAVRVDAPKLPARGREVPRYLLRLGGAVNRSLSEMRARRPDVVFGLGGYASVAPGIAALLTGRPLILLEQNVVPGKANLLLSRLGGRVAASYAASVEHLSAGARTRARVFGNPVRPELFAGTRDPERFGMDGDRLLLLVAGGSQGAEGLNDRVIAAASILAEEEIQVLMLSGPRDEDRVRRALASAGVRAWVAGFSTGMGTLYRTADLVLCRAGGTTIAELAALGRPSVLVPYPHHADRHQEMNAGALVRAGAARAVAEVELTPERFRAEVVGLLKNPEERWRMADAAAGLAVPDAADKVARWAREMIAR